MSTVANAKQSNKPQVVDRVDVFTRTTTYLTPNEYAVVERMKQLFGLSMHDVLALGLYTLDEASGRPNDILRLKRRIYRGKLDRI